MTADTASQARRPRRSAPVTCAVAGLALALWWSAPTGPLLSGPDAPLALLLLLGGFVLADVSQLHVEVRRQAVSLSLGEIPLVIGLFLVEPLELLAARLLATLAVELWRRTARHKVAFNTALDCAEVGAAALLFSAVAAGATTGPRSWLAAYVATVGAAALTGALVVLVITRTQGPLPRQDVALLLAPLIVGAMLSTTGALLALVTARADPRAIVLLLALLLLSLGAYRGYSTLLSRHRSLGQIRDFTAAMSAGGSADQLASAALRHARELLSAGEAVLVLDPRGRRPGSARVQRGDDEQPRALRPDPLADQVRAREQGLVLPRDTHDAELARWLEAQELDDAVIVPLLGVDGVVGTLQVGQRLGATSTFREADRQLLQMVAVHLEIALRSEDLLELLRYEATHDPLTGLPNRALFLDRVAEVQRQRAGGSFAVLLLGLDGFQDVNDTLGHHSGDTMLREVARRLEGSVPTAVVVARLGGDEFALLVPVGDEPDEPQLVAGPVLECLRQPMVLEAVALEARTSIGVVRSPDHGTDAALLLRRADIALHAAKQTRRAVVVYEADIDRSTPRRLALISELRTAIDSGRLVCHYQPKVCLDGRTVLGVEALVRWPHPSLGVVAPDDFIPMAERTGLIVPMTALVLRTALADCARWRGQGRDLTVAVNVSPRGLLGSHFVDEVGALLGATGVAPAVLTLEVTESTVMSDPGRAKAVLVELRELGVQLSIDDFGTGYSSLAYLRQLPVDEIKIDKSFVTDLATADGSTAIVRTIVELGHDLGLRVVAEGVEDSRSMAILSELGCDSVQGYLVSRPLPVEVFERWLPPVDQPPGPGRRPGPLTRPRLIALP